MFDVNHHLSLLRYYQTLVELRISKRIEHYAKVLNNMVKDTQTERFMSDCRYRDKLELLDVMGRECDVGSDSEDEQEVDLAPRAIKSYSGVYLEALMLHLMAKMAKSGFNMPRQTVITEYFPLPGGML